MLTGRLATQVPSEQRWSPALLALALGGAATLLVLITLTAKHTYGEIEAASGSRQHSYEILNSMRQMRRHVGEIRVGQAGYALTGHASYREVFDHAVAALAGDTVQLRQLLSDRPALARTGPPA